MVEMDQRFPGYGFAAHKGYNTPEHTAALNALGPCSEHRRSWRNVRETAGLRPLDPAVEYADAVLADGLEDSRVATDAAHAG